MARNKYSDTNIIELSEFRDLNEEEDIDSGTEGEGGEGGGEGKGGRGTGEPLVDPSIFGLTNYLLLEMLRQEERKFSHGWVPVTKEPRSEKYSGGEYIQGPPPHPLISQTQKFDGADKRDNPDPRQSEQGLERYQELRPNLQPSPQPVLTSTPKLTTGVPRLTK